MTMPFGPPGFTPPAAPAQTFGAPLSSAQALAGLGAADVESRMPFLPPGAAVRMKALRVYERNVTQGSLGLCYFLEGVVTDVAAPGGAEFWAGKRQENAQPFLPARVGAEYSCRISGISNPTSAAAALREYRELLCALWSHRGLTQTYGREQLAATTDDAARAAIQAEITKTWWTYGVMTAGYEGILAGRVAGDRAMAEQFAVEIPTRHVLVRTSVHVGKSGWGKLKHSFHPAE